MTERKPVLDNTGQFSPHMHEGQELTHQQMKKLLAMPLIVGTNDHTAALCRTSCLELCAHNLG